MHAQIPGALLCGLAGDCRCRNEGREGVIRRRQTVANGARQVDRIRAVTVQTDTARRHRDRLVIDAQHFAALKKAGKAQFGIGEIGAFIGALRISPPTSS